MKKFLYLLLATAMLATFGCTGDTNTNSVGTPNPNPFQPKGTVSGVLVDACTNEPIANADVYILDKKATTNSVGMFTIKKVPANTAVGNETDNTAAGLPLGSGTSLGSNGLNSWDTYNVVIDLSKVNAERAKVLGAKLYPSIAYHTVKVSYTSLGETDGADATATNHDTPVDGFVANIKPMVGKLSATLNIEAVDGNNGAVLSGATVQLISLSPFDGFNTPNNVTGNLVNTIATATTGADGKVSFTNVEAKHIFYAKVTWTNPANGHVWTGRAGIAQDQAGADEGETELENIPVVWTECDGTTTNFYTVGPNPPIKCYDEQEDNIHPYVAAVTPANLSDIAPSDTTQVVFTFSEVLQPTQYLLNTTEATSAVDGIWKDTVVQYDGVKYGTNMAFTMAWDSTTAPKVLTITMQTLGSSRYTVDIDDAVIKLVDTNGNHGVIKDSHFHKVTFTTAGGLDVTAPAISRQGITNNVEWLPVTNAYKYRVYAAEIRDGVTYGYVNAGETSFTTFDVSTMPGFRINDGETKISYSVYVVTLNTDMTESARSNAVVIDDKGRPTATLTSHDTLNYAFAANETITRTAVVDFSEVMNKPSVLAFGNWTIAITAANPITYAITNVVVSYPAPLVPGHTRATITYTVTNGATAQTPTAATLSTTATDLNGNAMTAALVGALIP